MNVKHPLLASTGASLLKRVGACDEAITWIRSLPEGTTARQAWQKCARGDHMLWLLGRTAGPPESDSRKRLVACECEVARLAWERMPAAARACVETAERWTRGEAPIEEVRAARSAAYYAADVADAADAAYASYAAAYAAYAADARYAYYAAYAAHADAARYASYAAAYAYYAADAADASYAADAARSQTLARAADIVRKHYHYPPRLRGAR